MSQGPIFLSAGIPSKNPQHYRRDPIAVAEAVRAFVAVNVVERDLVFGGHPAISPFVWEAADSLGAAERVIIYQSRFFQKLIPREAGYFNRLVWTPEVTGDREESLRIMREWMLIRRRFEDGTQLPVFAGGVFIGGEDGVEDEWNLFTAAYPGVPVFPIASTLGAAEHIFADPNRSGHVPPALRGDLAHEVRYRELFRRIARVL